MGLNKKAKGSCVCVKCIGRKNLSICVTHGTTFSSHYFNSSFGALSQGTHTHVYSSLLNTHTLSEQSDCLDYMGATVKHNQSKVLKGPLVQ